MKDAEITNKELLSTALCAARSKIQVTGDETVKISNEAKDSIISAQGAWSRKRLTTFPRTPELFRMERHGKPEILSFPGQEREKRWLHRVENENQDEHF